MLWPTPSLIAGVNLKWESLGSRQRRLRFLRPRYFHHCTGALSKTKEARMHAPSLQKVHQHDSRARAHTHTHTHTHARTHARTHTHTHTHVRTHTRTHVRTNIHSRSLPTHTLPTTSTPVHLPTPSTIHTSATSRSKSDAQSRPLSITDHMVYAAFLHRPASTLQSHASEFGTTPSRDIALSSS